MQNLTTKQTDVLEYIASQLAESHSPSQREIAAHFGVSQNAIYQIIRSLKKKGCLLNTDRHRGLQLSARYEHLTGSSSIPLVGRIAAGEPILAAQHIEDHIDVGKLLGLRRDVFMLKVHGDSMVDEGIMDGSYVTVDRNRQVQNGDIAAVLIDEDATVKRVHFKKDHILLEPANRKRGYKTKRIKRGDNDVRIIGKVTGCVNTF